MKRIAAAALAALALTAAVWAQSSDVQRHVVPPGDWHTINRELSASRYSPLTQINVSNVSRLAQAWTFAGAGGSSVPLVVDGVMYVGAGRRVVALDADTGKEIWAQTLAAPAPAPAAPATPPPAAAPAAQAGGGRGGRGGGPPGPTVSARGLAYWPGDGTRGPRLIFMASNRLVALDAATGMPAAGFGTNGMVPVSPGYNGTPTVYRNVAIIGAATQEVPQGPPGNPRAYDVLTGNKVWEFQTVPRAGEPFNETWGAGWKDRSGANMWGFAAPVDVERGIAYLPIAGPATNYYGGDRPGINAFANSIVAVEALTGKYLWHFQTVHHDIWDIDLPNAGALFDFVQDGKRVPAIAHVGKSSYVYVLDRVTGQPLIPVEERPVPKGDVPTEWYSPTQPFPVRPRPLSRVSFNPDTDLVRPEDTTPEHVAACKAMMARAGGYYNAGPFTPFMFKDLDAPPKSTIQTPGGTGGVNWGGMAINPTTGVFYVNAQNTTLVGWVQPRPPAQKDPETGELRTVDFAGESRGSSHPYDRGSVPARPGGNALGPFFTFSAPLFGSDETGMPLPGPDGRNNPNTSCVRPPWSKLYAVNANTGEIMWESVLGLNENLPAGKQLAGSGGSAGPTVTAGGLVFVGATSDGRFRAFDEKTGKELWVTKTPPGANGNSPTANANPMSYQGKSGKQYVAIVAGGTLVTYALP